MIDDRGDAATRPGLALPSGMEPASAVSSQAAIPIADDRVKWEIAEEDIEWTMRWSKHGGKKRAKEGEDPNADEQMFEDGPALAHMLINDVLFLNDHWWEEEWPEQARKLTSINVNCNDIFAWGCADAEELPYAEIENLYRAWRKDPHWGPAIWCIKRRNEMPQKPVEDRIRAAGVWDLDALGLRKNVTDAALSESLRATFAQGIEAFGRDAASRLDAKHESPVAAGDAPKGDGA